METPVPEQLAAEEKQGLDQNQGYLTCKEPQLEGILFDGALESIARVKSMGS